MPASPRRIKTPAPQLAALQKARCTRIFKHESLSGTTTQRPALAQCLKTLKPGDTLIVWKLDRLVRNLRDLIALLDALPAQGVKFQSLTAHIDTEMGHGRSMGQMIGAYRLSLSGVSSLSVLCLVTIVGRSGQLS
jgi:DNA invertase Pin-like site-specific DNA recombinase